MIALISVGKPDYDAIEYYIPTLHAIYFRILSYKLPSRPALWGPREESLSRLVGKAYQDHTSIAGGLMRLIMLKKKNVKIDIHTINLAYLLYARAVNDDQTINGIINRYLSVRNFIKEAISVLIVFINNTRWITSIYAMAISLTHKHTSRTNNTAIPDIGCDNGIAANPYICPDSYRFPP